MRAGCCLNMVSSASDKGTGISFIEELAGAGYDYVELPLAEIAALTEEEFLTVHKRVSNSGVSCEVCNNFFPKTIRLTGESVNSEEVMAYVDHALGRAARLGVEFVVFGSGPAKNVPDGFPMEEGYQQVVGLLKKIGPVARKYAITIVIEPLRSEECNLINTFEAGCRLADEVGDPNVKVLVDYYHMSVEKEPMENLKNEGRAYLKHVHLANPSGRVYPRKNSEADYHVFFETLAEIGYTGRISCEAYSDNFSKDAAAALKFLRDMMKA